MALQWNSASAPGAPKATGGGVSWSNSSQGSDFASSQAALGHSQAVMDKPIDWSQSVNTIGKATEGAVNQMGEGFNQANQSQSGGFLGGLGNMFAGVGKMIGGAAGVVAAPFAPLTQGTVGQMTQDVANKVSDNPNVQNFAMSPAGEATSKVAENVQNYNAGLGTVAGLGAAPEVGQAAGEFGQRFVTTPDEATLAAKAKTAEQVKGVADEWAKPTVPGKSKNPASFNTATQILAKSPDTPKFLAEQKLSPFQHIENGKYATTDSADALRSTAGELSKDALRPTLQHADYTIPKTPVSDVVKATTEDLKKGLAETPGSIETQIKNAQAEGEALSRKYPDGMSLTDMLDSSISYGKNGGFKPNGTLADNNTATMNRAFNRTLGDTLESKSPKDLPVADFRKYQSQYYKGADYLDALNNKKAPVSLPRELLNKGAGLIGYTGGHALTGGILGGVGGYMMGGAIEHAIENMTLPMRDSFLKNLQITKPEAFNQVMNFIGKENTEAALRPKLPPGKALGTPENPHLQPPAELGTSR